MFECLLLIHEIATNAEIKNKYRFVYTQLKHRLHFPEKIGICKHKIHEGNTAEKPSISGEN